MLNLDLQKRAPSRQPLPAMRFKLTNIILLFFSMTFLHGQTRSFAMFSVSADKTKFTSDSLDIFETYRFDNYTLLVGWTSGGSSNSQTPKLIIKNSKGKIIFSKLGQIDSYVFRPTFFKSDNIKDPIIILAESGSEYSWGNTAFLLKDNTVKELGHIDIGVNDSLDNASNIAPVTIIRFDRDAFTFHFNAKSVVFNPGGQSEKVYSGSDLCYIYKDGHLTLDTHCR